MKKLLMFAALVLVLLASSVQAEVPNTISYQGILAISGGEIVADGNYDLTFRLYNVQTGGTQLWQEDHNNVPVFQGRFNVILGSLTSLASVAFDEPYWLGITVEPPSTELSRIELTSSAYSLNTRSVMDNAVTSAKIQDGAIQFGDIGQNGTGLNQIMKWNGSAWTAQNDGGGVTDHGDLTGLGDDDHEQYLLVSRSDLISQFTGRLDIQQSGIQRLMDFRNAGGTRVGRFTICSGGNFQISADGYLNIGSDVGIVCTNETGTVTAPIYASAFNVSSTRAIKTDIRYLTESDCQQALADISSLRPATYQFKDATSGKGTHLGLIAEEMPTVILAPNGDAVDLYALTTELVAAVKALQAQVEQQSEIIKELRGQ